MVLITFDFTGAWAFKHFLMLLLYLSTCCLTSPLKLSKAPMMSLASSLMLILFKFL